eukprot:11059480-Alexandrium_andersonii.AAC.1
MLRADHFATKKHNCVATTSTCVKTASAVARIKAAPTRLVELCAASSASVRVFAVSKQLGMRRRTWTKALR